MFRRNGISLVIASLVLMAAAQVMAAPLVTVSLLGRVTGSGDPFSSSITVGAGQTVDYQLVVDMAPLTTQNINGSTTRTINSLTLSAATTGDGVNNFKVDLFQPGGDQTITSFGAGGTLNGDPSTLANDSWAIGSGAAGGTPNGSGLDGVRPAHTTGLQTGIDPEIVMTGVFSIVGTPTGAGQLSIRWTTGGAGTFKINGGTSVFPSQTTENVNVEPLIGYVPLLMNVPEPASMGLLGLASLSMLGIRRRKA